MARIVTVGIAIVSCLLIWRSGALDSMIGASQPVHRLDPGPFISQSGDAMRNLKSVHLSLSGTLVLNGVTGVEVTGSGDLVYPHKETLSLQLRIPAQGGQPDAIASVNERIENGREYLQVPAQSPAWKDVTGDQKGQIAPGMDPIDNLAFAHAFRASDDLGDITMDNIAVHHFSLNVDPGQYVEQLKSDTSSGVTAQDEAVLTTAGIQVEVWISTTDSLMHQMRINMATSQFTWNVSYHFSKFVKGGGPATA